MFDAACVFEPGGWRITGSRHADKHLIDLVQGAAKQNHQITDMRQQTFCPFHVKT
jgi:hypothetical protein